MWLFGVWLERLDDASNQGTEVQSGSLRRVIVEIVIARATALGLIISLWVFGEG